MDHDWAQIYFYIAGKTYKRWSNKTEISEELQVESLRDDQMSDLNRLKEWLYRKRTQARLQREQVERREAAEEGGRGSQEKG